MSDVTCVVDGCDKLRYQRRDMCGSHFMRWYRYGDPLYRPARKFDDKTGRRFGHLVALERVPPSTWICLCDCGERTTVLVGDLNNGKITSCGDGRHVWRDDVSYGAVHSRVTSRRGPAKNHWCIDCGERAYHWSYDHCDPTELITAGDDHVPAGLPYSLNPDHYDPRCVPCHKVFDLGFIQAQTPEFNLV